MKRLAKPVSIIIILVLVLFSAVSVLGISYYEGDFRRTPIKGFSDIDWGIDANGGARVTLTTSTDDEADSATIKEAAAIVEERCAKFGLVDYELYIHNDGNELSLVVPNSVNCEYSSSEVADLLTGIGNITLRPGEEYEQTVYDSSNSLIPIFPSGDTEQEILLSSAEIKSSSTFSYTEDKVNYYYLGLQYNDEGTALLSSMTNPMTGRLYYQTVSVWLDNRMLANPTVSEEITDGGLQFSNTNFTESKVKLYSAIVNSGTMPSGLVVKEYATVEPTAGDNTMSVLLYTSVAAALIIAVFMIIKYRTVGVVTLLMAFFQFAVLVAIISGFCFGGDSTFMLTIPGAIALAMSVMLTVISMIIIAERIKYQLRADNSVGVAVSWSLKKSFKNILDINVILAIVSLMGMFLFGTSGLIIGIFSGGAVSGIFNFSFVLFFGALINFFSGYVFPNLILRSLYSFKSLNKPSVFGGVKK